MRNHLQNERSPYLLQHADNPVDWYPWGPEAFAKAQAEDKPIFLSIGYSTCHWCHVMAEESFENEKVAQILNRHFVSVKVDREERPDVDAVYMEVCSALNGSGGWPLTVIMTPDQQPFFAGTYLPRESRGQYMGLIPLLTAVAVKWETDRESLLKAGTEITEHVRAAQPLGSGEPNADMLQKAVLQLAGSYDKEYGGFGTAPKFPSGHNLLFLLRFAALSDTKKVRALVEHTLQQMYRGGIFDHIGGGFARYSTDREWLAPHFEKTLYDNALLALSYTEAWQDGHLALYREVAEATLDYCLRELRADCGGFYSGQDADSEGVEGKYYLFTPAEVKAVLGEDDGRHFCECYDITEEGNFQGKSIPNLLLNTRWNLLPEGYEDFRERLRLYRAERCPLRTDQKLLTGWNGLMLMALSRAARVFDDPRYAAAARELAAFLLDTAGAARPEDLRAVCYEQAPSELPAQLDDYAFCALGLLELYDLDYDTSLLLHAEALARQILLHFADGEEGFFRTADTAEALIKRPKEGFDGALPSGNSAAAVLFDLLGRLSGRELWREAADRQLRYLCRHTEKYPAGSAFGFIALLHLLYPTRELVCVCRELPALLKSVTGKYAPELSVLVKRPGDEALAAFAPFTEPFAMQGEKATFYLCSGGACSLPFTEE
ncbi:MAG: thioredoxin domain-containing protein [Oscillospiraceae bacterium]|nr:thioredoxin domain-containing protein [Oscillospiraceae bacterium]